MPRDNHQLEQALLPTPATFADWEAHASRLGLRRNGAQMQGPCPACGGNDRFYVRGDNTLAFCRQCCPDHKAREAVIALYSAAGFQPPPIGRRKASRACPSRQPDHVTPYVDAAGQTVLEAWRWDRREGEDGDFWSGNKCCRPRYWNDAGRLVSGEPKGRRPYPLLGLPELLARPDLPVLWVEGEKAHARASAIFGERAVVVTNYGGARGSGAALAHTDWSPLAGRSLTVAPDHDRAGVAMAARIARHLGWDNVLVVDWTPLGDRLPAGWDMGDDLPPGVTAGDILRCINASAPLPEALRGPQTDLTEAGISELWLEQEGHDWRYLVPRGGDTGRWHEWTGQRYEPRSHKLVFRSLNGIANREATAANAVAGDDKAMRAAARALRKSTIPAGAERYASAARLDILDQYDSEPLHLNTPAGLLDLETGRLVAHDREQRHLKIAGAAPDPDAACPLWLGALERWCAGDTDMVAYMQRLVGYSLRGDNVEHAVALMVGPGANGKGSVLRVWQALLGDYARPASSRLLTRGRNEDHPTGLAALLGARLVSIPEVKAGAHFDEEQLKLLSGGDQVTARFMRQDFFDFTPQFLPLIQANEDIQTTDVGPAMQRRLHIIPFDVPIPEGERDPHLASKLVGELPAIMNWAVLGHAAYLRDGLVKPAAVQERTAEYFAEQDRVGRYLRQHTVQGPTLRVRAGPLYEDFARWVLAEDGGQPESSVRFAADMKKRYRRKEDGGGRLWLGLGWRPGGEPRNC